MEYNDKAKWINTILNELDKVDYLQSIKIIESCGKACLNSSDVPQKIGSIESDIQNKNDIHLLFKLYKEKIYNNSSRLYMEKNIIYLKYNECGCGMIEDVRINNPFLCHCTRGCTKAIFEKLFDKPVYCQSKKNQFLQGDDICEKEIEFENRI